MRFFDENGHYDLEPFPGCAAVVVSTHAFVYPELRGNGIGQQQHKERLMKAKDMGYGLILCTVRSLNNREKHILIKNGWSYYSKFVNCHTENDVELWGKVL